MSLENKDRRLWDAASSQELRGGVMRHRDGIGIVPVALASRVTLTIQQRIATASQRLSTARHTIAICRRRRRRRRMMAATAAMEVVEVVEVESYGR